MVRHTLDPVTLSVHWAPEVAALCVESALAPCTTDEAAQDAPCASLGMTADTATAPTRLDAVEQCFVDEGVVLGRELLDAITKAYRVAAAGPSGALIR